MNRRHFAALLAAVSVAASQFDASGTGAADAALGEYGAPQQSAVQRYQIFDLGAVGNGRSYALSVSSNNKAAGYVTFDIAGEKRPAIFEIGRLPVPIYTDGRGEATGINSRREVVGWYLRGTTRQAFFWKNNQIRYLMSPIGGHSHAAAINNRSEVVGYYEVAPRIMHAFHYWNGTMTDLGTWGGRSAQATAINANGDIAGFREIRLGGVIVKQGVRLRTGGTPQVFTPHSGFDNLVPTDINDNGDLAGSMSLNAAEFPEDAAMFIVRGSTVSRLNSSFCCYPFVGLALNRARQLVGYRFDQNGNPPWDAWLWSVQTGTETNLSLLPEVQAAGWYQLGQANDINNNGVIVGYGVKQLPNAAQAVRAFMMVPLAP